MIRISRRVQTQNADQRTSALIAHEWFTSSLFDEVLVDTVRTTFPRHEHEQFVAHYRGLLAAWARDDA